MFYDVAIYGKVFNAPLSDVFDYFSNISYYKKYYPNRCARVDILKLEDDLIETNEVWNVSIGLDISHISARVMYSIVPQKEIRFKILEGYGAGTENVMEFEGLGNKTRASLHFVPLHIMEILPRLRETEEFRNLLSYLINQDRENLEGKWPIFQEGQKCTKCNKGRLVDTGKKEDMITSKERRIAKYFRCTYCGQDFGNFRLEL